MMHALCSRLGFAVAWPCFADHSNFVGFWSESDCGGQIKLELLMYEPGEVSVVITNCGSKLQCPDRTVRFNFRLNFQFDIRRAAPCLQNIRSKGRSKRKIRSSSAAVKIVLGIRKQLCHVCLTKVTKHEFTIFH